MTTIPPGKPPKVQASGEGLVELPWTALKLPASMKNSPMRPRSNLNSPRQGHVVSDWSTWCGELHPMGWLINTMGWGLGQVVSKLVEKSGGGSVVLPKITHELIMWRTNILGIGALKGTCCTNFQTSWFEAFPELERWKFLKKKSRTRKGMESSHLHQMCTFSPNQQPCFTSTYCKPTYCMTCLWFSKLQNLQIPIRVVY